MFERLLREDLKAISNSSGRINFIEEGKKSLKEKVEETEKQKPYCSSIGGKCFSCDNYLNCPAFIYLKF